MVRKRDVMKNELRAYFGLKSIRRSLKKEGKFRRNAFNERFESGR